MSSVIPLELYQQKNVADGLLIQLDSAQKLLIESIADLSRATSRSEPDRGECAKVRLRLSQASLARSAAFTSACEFLRPRIEAQQWTIVAALKAAETGLRMHSAAHHAEWTNERVEADWPGYCLASKGMRMRMGEIIQRERAILHPLLEQVSGNRVPECLVRDERVVSRGF